MIYVYFVEVSFVIEYMGNTYHMIYGPLWPFLFISVTIKVDLAIFLVNLESSTIMKFSKKSKIDLS